MLLFAPDSYCLGYDRVVTVMIGEMGPVYYTIFLAIWVTLLLPCTILEVVPGYLFGLKVGTIVSIIGKSSGSFIRLVRA